MSIKRETSPVGRRAIEEKKLPVDRRAVAILPVGRRPGVLDAQWFAETALVDRMEQQLHTDILGRRRVAVRPWMVLPGVRRAIWVNPLVGRHTGAILPVGRRADTWDTQWFAETVSSRRVRR